MTSSNTSSEIRFGTDDIYMALHAITLDPNRTPEQREKAQKAIEAANAVAEGKTPVFTEAPTPKPAEPVSKAVATKARIAAKNQAAAASRKKSSARSANAAKLRSMLAVD